MTVAVDWLAIKNDYINGLGNHRELSEKYGVPQSTIRKRSASEKWAESKEEQRNIIGTLVEQKTAAAIAEKETDRIRKLLEISDRLIQKIERAVEELDLAQVTNKTKVKVIEYNNTERADKPTKETITEKEEILEVRSIIDRKGLQQIATALKAVWDMSAEESGGEGKKNNLLDAIQNTEEIDTDDLPEVE